jgi:hypothetical protein
MYPDRDTWVDRRTNGNSVEVDRDVAVAHDDVDLALGLDAEAAERDVFEVAGERGARPRAQGERGQRDREGQGPRDR